MTNHPSDSLGVDAGLIKLKALRHLTHRSTHWIMQQVDAQPRLRVLWKRAETWTQRDRRWRHQPHRRPILLNYLTTVGMPETMAAQVVWAAMQEDWSQVKRRRPSFPLPSWEAISDPSWKLTPLPTQASSLTPSTDYSGLHPRRSSLNSGKTPSLPQAWRANSRSRRLS